MGRSSQRRPRRRGNGPPPGDLTSVHGVSPNGAPGETEDGNARSSRRGSTPQRRSPSGEPRAAAAMASTRPAAVCSGASTPRAGRAPGARRSWPGRSSRGARRRAAPRAPAVRPRRPQGRPRRAPRRPGRRTPRAVLPEVKVMKSAAASSASGSVEPLRRRRVVDGQHVHLGAPRAERVGEHRTGRAAPSAAGRACRPAPGPSRSSFSTRPSAMNSSGTTSTATPRSSSAEAVDGPTAATSTSASQRAGPHGARHRPGLRQPARQPRGSRGRCRPPLRLVKTTRRYRGQPGHDGRDLVVPGSRHDADGRRQQNAGAEVLERVRQRAGLLARARDDDGPAVQRAAATHGVPTRGPRRGCGRRRGASSSSARAMPSPSGAWAGPLSSPRTASRPSSEPTNARS